MYADDALRPWYEIVVAQVPGLAVTDVHTHLGQNDPDGFKCALPELLEALAQADARGVVFPMAEPTGYPEANDTVMAQAAEASDRLTAFCRVDPNTGAAAVAEARRCLDAGAAGIKLHPRAEGFTLDHEQVVALAALAHERRAPIIVHAGRGIPALGRHAVSLATEYPDARIILAHVGLSDLGWIWQAARTRPNLFFDTAWWNPADLLVLYGLVPPGQILFGSDVPYGTTMSALAGPMRCALQVGLTAEQLRGVASAQTERLLTGDDPLDLGPPPGLDRVSRDPLLDRAHTYLTASLPLIMRGGDPDELLALTRLCCDVDGDAAHPEAYRSILALLDRRDRLAANAELDERTRRGGHLVVTAGVIARTPDVPLPSGSAIEDPEPPR